MENIKSESLKIFDWQIFLMLKLKSVFFKINQQNCN